MATSSYELGIGLAAEHGELADAVRKLTEREITSETLRAAVDAKTEQLPPFWQAVAAQGLLGLHVAEHHGGQGAGLLETAVALEALGRAAHPGPFLPTVLASALLSAVDSKSASYLPGLADGSRTGAVALGDPFTGRRTSDGLVLSGTTAPVLGGMLADLLIVPAEVEGQTRWCVVESGELAISAQDGVDVTRGAARVTADDVELPADRVLGGLSSLRVRSIAAVLLGAEAVGVASWCTSTAADYAKTRVQFGRPIGQFQGVKHKCAHMGIALEKARAVVWDAAVALDGSEDTADHAAAIAAVLAPETAVEAAQDCIQVLGGIGFTWEHDAHLYYRRALALRGLLGSRENRVADVAEDALRGIARKSELDLPEEAEGIRTRVRAELSDIAALGEEQRLAPLGDNGWVQPHLPEPWGKAAGPLEQLVIHQELRAAGITLPELAMGGWAVQAIVTHGTEQQKQRHVPATLRGEVVWCQLFSEPGAGSDLASLTTRATRVDGGWQVNGSKIWTSLAQFSEWAILIARTDPDAPKHDGISYFLLDMSTAGVTVRPLRELTGSALFNEVFLDDVFVPDGNLVGEVNDGWHVARTTLAGERLALSQGIALYASMDDLLKLVDGRGLSAVARDRIGELVCENQAIELLSARMIISQLAGNDVGTTSSVGKFLSMRIGQWIAEFGVDLLGEAGAFSMRGEPSDKWIDALLAGRATTIYGGTTEVQLNVIAERMLGLPRDAGS